MLAKKSLGQNFLKSESALKKIISTGNISAGGTILEIGPGMGALTEYLLATDANIISIEADIEMINFLKQRFAKEISTEKLKLIHGDILEFDIEKFNTEKSRNFLQKNIASGQSFEKYKLIANIPYYITGEIIRKFLSSNNQPTDMVLLVQKEVADRICAKDGKESLLSISVKTYCDPKIIQTVKAGSFVPAPKVDSAIIHLKNISKSFFEKNKITEKEFFKILHAGFAHKRKMLFSNIKKSKLMSTEEIEKVIKKSGTNKKIRAENLKPEDWLCFFD
ncbi:MAG TPA: 16S rRNA (adenine(1518)-N(6)/adenine(1519)-N(6))-dimethyltransferase RsmA [Candidatus Paceibacterota bacterium]|mgnify:CR=1 FL=1|nr:16S rRNA (adenine(1518)-N(6)/adenine(1519)-N(6))-dimethyltransferase RsmA [Candidatus Paceibacterota bacterium]